MGPSLSVLPANDPPEILTYWSYKLSLLQTLVFLNMHINYIFPHIREKYRSLLAMITF